MPPPLTTERLTLLPYSLATEAHLDGLVAAWDDPEVWRYVGAGRDGFCRADLDGALERAKERGLLDGELLVVRTSDGAVLGACGLYPSWLDGGTPDETDLGYRFGRAFWGQGYGGGGRGPALGNEGARLDRVGSNVQSLNVASHKDPAAPWFHVPRSTTGSGRSVAHRALVRLDRHGRLTHGALWTSSAWSFPSPGEPCIRHAGSAVEEAGTDVVGRAHTSSSTTSLTVRRSLPTCWKPARVAVL